MSIQTDDNMLVPLPWSGLPSQCEFLDVKWLKSLSDRTWLALWQRYPDQDLPLGYRSYVVSFHLEAVDVEWIRTQCDRIDAPIILLFDGSYYNWPRKDNLYPICYFYWHHQCRKIQHWHGKQTTIPERKYLASAVCSRITQSKLLTFTAIAEHIGIDQSRLILSDWLEEKNVHGREKTGNRTLDLLSDIFWSNYFGKKIKQDVYDQELNYQKHTSNFKTNLYQDCAIHFTNESYHYSQIYDNIRPGPFLTEKTFKCIVGGQPFIPVGQFDTYGTLSKLGFKFDYDFDISWDQDPGNLTRLESIVKLIKEFSKWSVNDIDRATRSSTVHNLEHLNSGDFAKTCERHNQIAMNQVFDMLT